VDRVRDWVRVGVGDHAELSDTEGDPDPDPDRVELPDLVTDPVPDQLLEGVQDLEAVAVGEGRTEEDREGDAATTPSHLVSLGGLSPASVAGFRANHPATLGTPPVEAKALATVALVGTMPPATVTDTLLAPLSKQVAMRQGAPLGPRLKKVHHVLAAASHWGNPPNAAVVTAPPCLVRADTMGSPNPCSA